MEGGQLALLFFAGIIHWCLFFNFGRMNFRAYDWPKEHAYYSVLRESLLNKSVPFHISSVFQDTNRFLALPETNLLPHILLLPIMPVPAFIFAHILIMYSVGFLGCLFLKKHFGLGLIPFTFLYLLFNFNGYISSHIAVGHTMWSGYFLLPFFCLHTFKLTEKKEGGRRLVYKISFVLFLVGLAGAFHIYIWCAVFLLILGLSNPRCLRKSAGAVFLSAGCLLFRILPAALTFWNKGYPYLFISGYPKPADIINALMTAQNHEYFPFPSRMGWWEFDIYIGVIGAAVLFFYFFFARAARKEGIGGLTFREFDAALLLFLIFSLDIVFRPIASLHIPLLNFQRYSSRFIILPLLIALIVSAARMQKMDFSRPASKITACGWYFLAALLAASLFRHSFIWRISGIEKKYPFAPLPQVTIAQQPDRMYISLLAVSSAASLAFIIFTFHSAFTRKNLK
ncbi:MAG: hypothetical protein PHE18_04720 [Candidatus Omnitrophica bacterium]|nr:hypothetical protein [Candidatus Omnitrophota bacterium]MDD5553162.1 hypothetical protein [Candidatus Omnitrophota bacterium]